MFFECVQFGWLRNEEEEILVPVMVAEEVQVLPNKVSRVLACNCKAAELLQVFQNIIMLLHFFSVLCMLATQPNATMNGQ